LYSISTIVLLAANIRAMVFGNLHHYSFIVSTLRAQLARGVCMKAQKRRLNGASLATQGQHVLRLDDEVLSASRADEADEYAVCRESSRDLWECKDDGRRLRCLEADGNPVVRALACLARVGRAPEKIEDGTHGFSDVTGRQIPQERLEMVPDAICTLDEEQAFERADEPGRLQ
jgi:DnaK suppressor protein